MSLADQARARGHQHGEAFRLMRYETADGSEVEWIWNSRDGVTPFAIRLASGAEARHVRWPEDLYLPDHEPEVGERVFVDLHPERALEIARRKVEEFWDHPTYPMRERWETKDEAARVLWEDFMQPGAPDLVEVTDYLAEVFAERARRYREGLIGAMMDPPPDAVRGDVIRAALEDLR